MPVTIRETWDDHGHFYKDVPTYSDEVHETVLVSGETVRVLRFIANGAYLDDTLVALWWDKDGDDEELLAAAHGDARIPMERELTGDGSKKLSIVLSNATGSAHVMGGRWDAEHG